MRLRPWTLALILIAICAAIIGAMEWRRRTRDFSGTTLYSRLPLREGLIFRLDVQSLRSAGWLDLFAGSRTAEETDYKNFVARTGFDYRADLDSILGYVSSEEKIFLLNGRFNWEQISEYAKQNGARCLNGFCSTETRSGRWVSFVPISESVLAVGVGTNGGVAYSALQVNRTDTFTFPEQPFWISVPRSSLLDPSDLPEGTRAFASALKEAHRLLIGVQPVPDGVEARMRADFPATAQAEACRVRLEELTALLRKFLLRDGRQPAARDLTNSLVNGQFQNSGAQLTARWPIHRELFESMVGGR